MLSSLLSLWLPSPVVAAESQAASVSVADRVEARRLAREGMRLLDAQRPSEALAHFKQASSLLRAPTLSVLEGQALARLGRLQEARAILRKVAAQKLPPNAPRAYVLAQKSANSELRDLSKRMPRIAVRASSKEVWVDGRPVALVGDRATVEVDPGLHTVTAPGRAAISVEVAEYSTAEVDLDQPDPDKSSTQATLGWVSIGVGAAAVTGGVALGALAMKEKGDLDEACPEQRCPPSQHDDLARLRTYKTLSTVGYVVGLAGLGTGIVLLTTQSGERARARPRVVLSASPVNATLSGVF